MGPLIVAWLVGEGIIVYRSAVNTKAPPGPGQLLLSSGVFVILALLAESEKMRMMATLLAWGFDIAAFMNLVPAGPGGAESQNPHPWPPPKLPDTVQWPGQQTTTTK